MRFLNVASTGLPHDHVTERHLVLLLPPLDLDLESSKTAQTFLDAHLWRPDRPTRVLVETEDLQTHFWTELPAQWVFHFGNGWEDADGIIRFDAASAPDPSAMFGAFRTIMAGENAMPDARRVLFSTESIRGRGAPSRLPSAIRMSSFPC